MLTSVATAPWPAKEEQPVQYKRKRTLQNCIRGALNDTDVKYGKWFHTVVHPTLLFVSH